MILSGRIEPDNHNGAIVKFEKRWDKQVKKLFVHLYGFMLLCSSIVSDNYNGAIEKCGFE